MIVSVPISIGELLDKISILRIKRWRIRDGVKLASVEHELTLLSAARLEFNEEVMGLEMELQAVNVKLWNIEDEIRRLERMQDFGSRFVDLARQVYRRNDERAEIKRRINEITESSVVEQKSYGDDR